MKVSKVKVTLVQALRLCTGRTAHRGSRGTALPFHNHGTRRGEGSVSRPGRSLPPGKTRYPLYRRLGGPQGRSWKVGKISPPTGIRSRTVQPVVSRYTDWATRPTLVTGIFEYAVVWYKTECGELIWKYERSPTAKFISVLFLAICWGFSEKTQSDN